MAATYQSRAGQQRGGGPPNMITGQQQINEAKAKLERGKAEIQKIAGSLVSADELIRFTLNACIKNPKLFDCFDSTEGTASVFLSIITSRIVEIPCDGIHGYLVPFFDSKKNAMICQFMAGYKGFAQLAYHNPNISSVNCAAVYEFDEFDFEYGTEAYLRHKPKNGDRGQLLWAYAIFKTKNGDSEFRVLTKDEVLKRKAVSKSRDSGPWRDWEAEMWAKTAFLALAKVAPMGNKVARAAAIDDKIQTHGTLTEQEIRVIEKEPLAALGQEQYEPAFTPQDTDDRRQMEPASKSQERRQTAQKEAAAPQTPRDLFTRLQSAPDEPAIREIETEANDMVRSGQMSQAQRDELAILCNDARRM